MKKLILVTVLLFVFLINAVNVSAFTGEDLEVEKSIRIEGSAEVPISIRNQSGEELDLVVEFYGPNGLNYEFVGLPSSIEGSDKIDIIMRITPNPRMIGNDYVTNLAVTLGEETVMKEIKMQFRAVEEEKTEDTETGDGTTETTAGIGFPFLGMDAGMLVVNGILAIVAVILVVLFISKVWEIKKRKESREEGYEAL